MINNTNKQCLTLILICISYSASAEWTLIQSSDEGNMYIDFDSIDKTTDALKVWTLYDYQLTQDKHVQSAKSHETYDCRHGKFKVLSISRFSDHMGVGELIDSYHYDDSKAEWYAVAPYTSGELKKNIICSKN